LRCRRRRRGHPAWWTPCTDRPYMLSDNRRHTPTTRDGACMRDPNTRHQHGACMRDPNTRHQHTQRAQHTFESWAGQTPLGAQGGVAAAQQPCGPRVHCRRERRHGLGNFGRMRLKRGGQGLARDRRPRLCLRRRLCRPLRWRDRRRPYCARCYCACCSSYSCAARGHLHARGRCDLRSKGRRCG
jgi:hypothetical protein